ncbi:hypothetical protein EVG20_g3764 [Dentipellis fragilis]|uniref:DnaJ homologue subfamily C member 28 conserved domain-containing protein n=1 Tax=Dentipellis fragilis TaxID=205917 RepID=A0A4Y9Z1J7_9AGAM|nr:hypothetical protein EVG20_g3764 [Dentipellis fragilis]
MRTRSLSHTQSIISSYKSRLNHSKPSRFFSCTPHTRSDADHRASSKLFADAEREEAQKAPQPKNPLLNVEHENWTGEESMQDAVLRMLVDKYKPLRGGTIQTAEQKLRQAPPPLSSVQLPPVQDFSSSSTAPSTTPRTPASWANEPLIPAVEGHRPWHTTFKAPSHATSSVRCGSFPPIVKPSTATTAPDMLDDKARRKEREVKKRTQTAGRLSRAKESTLEYRLGIKSSHVHSRPNPSSVKGWQGLVEERIERARSEGHFRTIKGMGQPIQRSTEESNPFIAREEYLMNRIVQRQGAAPPWVEIQGELETAVTSFRELLRQSWVRRAIRMLTLSQPATLLPTFTLSDAVRLRDAEWEERERAYHDTAVEELNSLVRKYNAMAPYAVRRPYYMRSVELDKAYQDAGYEILQGLAAQSQQKRGSTAIRFGDEEDGVIGGGAPVGRALRIRDVIRSWFGWEMRSTNAPSRLHRPKHAGCVCRWTRASWVKPRARARASCSDAARALPHSHLLSHISLKHKPQPQTSSSSIAQAPRSASPRFTFLTPPHAIMSSDDIIPGDIVTVNHGAYGRKEGLVIGSHVDYAVRRPLHPTWGDLSNPQLAHRAVRSSRSSSSPARSTRHGTRPLRASSAPSTPVRNSAPSSATSTGDHTLPAHPATPTCIFSPSRGLTTTTTTTTMCTLSTHAPDPDSHDVQLTGCPPSSSPFPPGAL